MDLKVADARPLHFLLAQVMSPDGDDDDDDAPFASYERH